MLRLRNIVKSDTQISADYYPEDSEVKGFVSVDIESGEILDSDTTSYDEPFNAYLSHAVQALSKMADSDTMPPEKVIMWY